MKGYSSTRGFFFKKKRGGDLNGKRDLYVFIRSDEK